MEETRTEAGGLKCWPEEEQKNHQARAGGLKCWPEEEQKNHQAVAGRRAGLRL
jgi:hypothetical protein